MIVLTKEQQEAIASTRGTPHIVDPRTNKEYVLVPVADFQAYLDMNDNDPEQIALRRAALRNAAKKLVEDAE